MMRWVYGFLGCVALALGVLGVFLPLLPTTPFVLVSAFFFAKSSERLHQWLITHPWFSESIRNWEERGAIPVYAKILSSSMMSVSVGVLCWRYWHTPQQWLAITAGAICLSTAVWIWRRPS